MTRISLAIASLALAVCHGAAAGSWQGHGGNAQHTAVAPAPAQKIGRIVWTTPIDLKPQLTGGELLIHYGSPIVTARNTLILPVKVGAADGFRIEAHNTATGATIWTENSSYSLPAHDWTPSYGPVLTLRNRLYFADGAGIIRYRDTPDQATGAGGWIAFYGNAAYVKDAAGYRSAVHISTPLTADSAGNIYFGFTAGSGAPGGLVSGIARVSADGTASWISAASAAGDPAIAEVQTNCAPAISADQKTVYIAVSNGPRIGTGDGYSGYLLGLDAATLAPKYKVFLEDPSNGGPASLDDDSTASPTVAPDGDIFIGVLGRTYPFHNGRGWLLHFNATLTRAKVPGSFGWDSTASIVPAAAVPSYSGLSRYLLMSKYNNYAGIGAGNGHNEIAILDPASSQLDLYSTTKVRVMREVLTIAGPTQFPGGGPGQTYEWCIDSAAVDPATSSAFANSEDGHLYRWDLRANQISQRLFLNAPRPEAYTPTVVGVDGKVYAINNATLYAISR